MWRRAPRSSILGIINARTATTVVGGAVVPATAFYLLSRTIYAESHNVDGTTTQEDNDFPGLEIWEEEKEPFIRPYIRRLRQTVQEECRTVAQWKDAAKEQGRETYDKLGLKHIDDISRKVYLFVREKPAAGAILGLGVITPFALRTVIGFRVGLVLSLVGTPVGLYMYEPGVLDCTMRAAGRKARHLYGSMLGNIPYFGGSDHQDVALPKQGQTQAATEDKAVETSQEDKPAHHQPAVEEDSHSEIVQHQPIDTHSPHDDHDLELIARTLAEEEDMEGSVAEEKSGKEHDRP